MYDALRVHGASACARPRARLLVVTVAGDNYGCGVTAFVIRLCTLVNRFVSELAPHWHVAKSNPFHQGI